MEVDEDDSEDDSSEESEDESQKRKVKAFPSMVLLIISIFVQ